MPLFDFNEKSGQHGFTPMHYAVVSNNFTLISMLLSSQEELNLEIRDYEHRIPLDHCFSISSIYKTLKRALKKQRGPIGIKNLKVIQSIEPDDQTHRIENIKHENLNRRSKQSF